MQAKFITHPDFSTLKPINIYHKEMEKFVYGHPDEYKNKHILFRNSLNIKNCKKAILKISADDHYKLYINGSYVACGPSPTHPSSYYYNELDVSEYIRTGKNVFAIHTYYQGFLNRVWVSGDLRSMLWFSLTVDGKEVLVSDESWRCTYHTAYTACGIYGYDTAIAECYDSSSPEDLFFESEYDDGYWQFAAKSEYAAYNLRKQPTSPVSVYSVTPKIIEQRDGYVFVDLAQEMAGILSVEATGNAGDEIILRFAEELLDNGRVRYDMRCNCTYEEKWILSGKSRDVLRQFDYKAFRYAEIIHPKNVSIGKIEMNVRHYPIDICNSPKSANDKLNSILKLCENTIKYGTQEIFVDCPTREKGQYLGDVCISARAYTVLTGNTTPIKKSITDFFDTAFVCPGLLAVSSSAFMQEIADYSLLAPSLINWVYKIDNDKDFLLSAVPYLTAIYNHFLKFTRNDYLLDGVCDKWNLVDWPENLRDGYDFPLTKPIGRGAHNVINAFWYGFLCSLDEFYTLCGKPKTGMTEKVKESFINAFYSKKTGLFCDSESLTHSAIHSNILPLLYNIDKKDDPELSRRILNMLKEKGLCSMGVYMAYFALCAVKRVGEHQLAIELATDERCWLNMLKEGATTTFEAWGKEQKDNTSLFHPWATCPIIIFQDKYPIY